MANYGPWTNVYGIGQVMSRIASFRGCGLGNNPKPDPVVEGNLDKELREINTTPNQDHRIRWKHGNWRNRVTLLRHLTRTRGGKNGITASPTRSLARLYRLVQWCTAWDPRDRPTVCDVMIECCLGIMEKCAPKKSRGWTRHCQAVVAGSSIHYQEIKLASYFGLFCKVACHRQAISNLNLQNPRFKQ